MAWGVRRFTDALAEREQRLAQEWRTRREAQAFRSWFRLGDAAFGETTPAQLNPQGFAYERDRISLPQKLRPSNWAQTLARKAQQFQESQERRVQTGRNFYDRFIAGAAALTDFAPPRRTHLDLQKLAFKYDYSPRDLEEAERAQNEIIRDLSAADIRRLRDINFSGEIGLGPYTGPGSTSTDIGHSKSQTVMSPGDVSGVAAGSGNGPFDYRRTLGHELGHQLLPFGRGQTDQEHAILAAIQDDPRAVQNALEYIGVKPKEARRVVSKSNLRKIAEGFAPPQRWTERLLGREPDIQEGARQAVAFGEAVPERARPAFGIGARFPQGATPSGPLSTQAGVIRAAAELGPEDAETFFSRIGQRPDQYMRGSILGPLDLPFEAAGMGAGRGVAALGAPPWAQTTANVGAQLGLGLAAARLPTARLPRGLRAPAEIGATALGSQPSSRIRPQAIAEALPVEPPVRRGAVPDAAQALGTEPAAAPRLTTATTEQTGAPSRAAAEAVLAPPSRVPPTSMAEPPSPLPRDRAIELRQVQEEAALQEGVLTDPATRRIKGAVGETRQRIEELQAQADLIAASDNKSIARVAAELDDLERELYEAQQLRLGTQESMRGRWTPAYGTGEVSRARGRPTPMGHLTSDDLKAQLAAIDEVRARLDIPPSSMAEAAPPPTGALDEATAAAVPPIPAKQLPQGIKDTLIKRARRAGLRVSDDGFVETECF